MKGPLAESPRFPAQRSSAQGESAPKARPKGVVDGKQVNIPVPPHSRLDVGVTQKDKRAYDWKCRLKCVGGSDR